MFRRILFATDFTSQSAEAQAAALAMAKAFGSGVEVLHAIEPIAGEDQAAFDDFYRELEARAKAQLKAIVATFAAAKVKVKAAVVIERRWRAIVDRADPRSCDLVVLGSGPTSAEHAGGSISHQVFLNSRVPVLIVRGKTGGRAAKAKPRRKRSAG